MSIKQNDFFSSPVSSSNPLILLQQILHFDQQIHLLFRILAVSPFDLLIQIVNSIISILQIFKDELSTNNLHISNGIHVRFSMGDIFVFECPNDMINTINFLNVTQEMIS